MPLRAKPVEPEEVVEEVAEETPPVEYTEVFTTQEILVVGEPPERKEVTPTLPKEEPVPEGSFPSIPEHLRSYADERHEEAVREELSQRRMRGEKVWACPSCGVVSDCSYSEHDPGAPCRDVRIKKSDH